MTIHSLTASCSSLFIASLLSFGAMAQESEESAPSPSGATGADETTASSEPPKSAAAQSETEGQASAPAEAAPAEAAPAEAAPAEAAPAEAAPAEATNDNVAEAATMGSISVSSTPAGEIYLDGEPLNLTTPAMDIPVAPGSHTLRVVDTATGMEKTVTFDVENSVSLQLELALETATNGVAEEVAEAPTPKDNWSWMTVAGWGGLSLGTMGLVSGAVVLTTPYDPDQETLGFGLFGAGAGMILGGGVLLYLDGEMADQSGADGLKAGSESEPSAMLPKIQPIARR